MKHKQAMPQDDFGAYFTLIDFLFESNRIEGILTSPTEEQRKAAIHFLALSSITIPDLVHIVNVFQPGAVLRDKEGLNVRVGNHIPPSGGSYIKRELQRILEWSRSGVSTPYYIHQLYETLHPFTDGNGRSGRLLWLYQMGGIEKAPLGFLHSWYYQSLSERR